MFKCEKCGKQTKAYEKENKLVVKTREVPCQRVVRDKDGNKVYDYKEKKNKLYDSTKTEIVKEISVCEECFEEVD